MRPSRRGKKVADGVALSIALGVTKGYIKNISKGVREMKSPPKIRRSNLACKKSNPSKAAVKRQVARILANLPKKEG